MDVIKYAVYLNKDLKIKSNIIASVKGLKFSSLIGELLEEYVKQNAKCLEEFMKPKSKKTKKSKELVA